jgi:hypothetical protein
MVIFVESQRKPSDFFVVLNFEAATRPVLGRGAVQMMIDTLLILLDFLVFVCKKQRDKEF